MKMKKKYIAIGVISLIIVIMIIVMFVIKGNNKEKVLLDFYDKITQKDYEAMYQLIDNHSQNIYDEETFIKRNQNIYEGMEVSDIKITIQSKEKDSIQYQVQMNTLAGEIIFENKTTFKNSKIIWDDSFIYPQLTKDSKIRIVEEEAQRGSILDREGVILAGTGEAYSVGLVPSRLNGENDYQKIASLLNMSVESIQKIMSASWIKEDSFVPLRTISKGQESLENLLLNIPGVKLTTVKVRTYPYGEMTSHVVGYVQKVTAEDLEKHKGDGYHENSYIGRSGIEAAYEKELKGKDGLAIYIINQNGNIVDTIVKVDKQDGENISLTLDIALQRELYETFSQEKSASVALNPETGEVLALVSTPSFNSNDFILGMSQEKWDSLNNDEKQPLYNRYRASWVPGSSMKPITGAIGLDSKSLDKNEDLKAEMKWQNDASWGDYFVTTLHAASPNTLVQAIIASDNVYFAKAALKIGRENLKKGYKVLKIGEEIPFELSLMTSQYASVDLDNDILIADSGYGQGELLINPVQMACLYSGFANNGTIMQPHLIKGESNIWIEEAYTKETVTTIMEGLKGVVKNVGGYNNQIIYAGKTGTAEIKATQNDTTGTELGWFTVFSINSSKPIVISTMVEDVKGRGGSTYVAKSLIDPIHHYQQ